MRGLDRDVDTRATPADPGPAGVEPGQRWSIRVMCAWSIRVMCALTCAFLLTHTARAATPDPAATGTPAPPIMGWTSWSSMRGHPTLAGVEADARALVSSGLAAAGYDYVNVDDYWYVCGSREGPAVDRYGRWVVDAGKFPPDPATGRNGIQVLADYVHGLGLKFGLYVTPGVPNQAVSQDTPVEGTLDTAAAIVAHGPGVVAERNFNACGSAVPGVSGAGVSYTAAGALPIDYRAPGAQAFVDSWADEFADWGVDYLKLDGVSSADTGDIGAWSRALAQTGRPIQLELSNDLAIGAAATYRHYAAGWRTNKDIELDPDGHPGTDLTNWARVAARFDSVGEWQPFVGSGAYNDLDAVEIGDGPHDGVSVAERESYLSLWALGASPLLLGADLTQLNSTDLRLLQNPGVVGIDQDGIAARRVVDAGAAQVFAKTEADGSVIIGLFNASNRRATRVSVNLRDAGVATPPASATDVWTGLTVGPFTGGSYRVRLGPGAVQLLQTPPGTAEQGNVSLAWQAPNTLSGGATAHRCTVQTAASGVQSTPSGPCAFAGGGLVDGLGGPNSGAVSFRRIRAGSAGRYLLDFGYAVHGTGRFTVTVNGARPTSVVVSGASTLTPATASMTVELRHGTNTIRFSGRRAGAPALDDLTVTPAGQPPAA